MQSTDVDTRFAHICFRAGEQANQHQSLLHAISRTLKWLGILHQIERAELFTTDRNLRMDIVVRRRRLRDAPNREHTPNREHRDKSIARPASAGTPTRRQS